ncbi:MAG: DUF309 domain-containing protein [Bacteroidota bacterium]
MSDFMKGVDLFNDGAYFEAHDIFEDLWMESDQNDKDLYQGLVQISVGSYHLISGNYSGALSQYQKGIKKLENYRTTEKNINLEKFLIEFKPFIEKIIMFNSKKISNIEITKIPTIEKYKH